MKILKIIRSGADRVEVLLNQTETPESFMVLDGAGDMRLQWSSDDGRECVFIGQLDGEFYDGQEIIEG